MVKRLLILISLRARPDQGLELLGYCYPQAWWFWGRIAPRWLRGRPFRAYMHTIKWLCGLLVGHEISLTERGYGGGPYEDRHCRWCDKLFHVPIGEFARTWGEVLTKEPYRFH